VIIVTGGAGFLGSNMVAALNRRGTEVVVCDRLRSNDKWRNLAKAELAGFVHPEDLLGFLDAHAVDLEAVVHMGAISATTVTDGDAVVRANLNLSLGLWEWCTTHHVRLIYASSAATYGDGGQGFDDDGSSQALARLRPLNLYGWSKHVFDRRVARLVEGGRPRPPQWVGLKLFNVYGPNEYHKGDMRSVVAKLYPRVVEGEPARLFRSHRPDYPDGGQSRDFIYVRDCVQVMTWLLDHRQVNGIFNVGTGEARSFADLATAVMRAAGREPLIEYFDMPEDLRPRYQYYTRAPMERLRAAGYTAPFTSLEEGVADYVTRYLAGEDPYV
jgi:ADP-L-glycero-D-manno-heptose 6-epimerase